MSENSKQTIIEEGTVVDGAIRSECPVTVSGRLKGQLNAPSLTVRENGAVDGEIEVLELNVEYGEISGAIDADTVQLSGRVNDRTVINARTLEVKLDQPQNGLQVTFGNCELVVGENHAKAKGKSSRQETPVKAGVDEKVPVTSEPAL